MKTEHPRGAGDLRAISRRFLLDGICALCKYIVRRLETGSHHLRRSVSFFLSPSLSLSYLFNVLLLGSPLLSPVLLRRAHYHDFPLPSFEFPRYDDLYSYTRHTHTHTSLPSSTFYPYQRFSFVAAFLFLFFFFFIYFQNRSVREEMTLLPGPLEIQQRPINCRRIDASIIPRRQVFSELLAVFFLLVFARFTGSWKTKREKPFLVSERGKKKTFVFRILNLWKELRIRILLVLGIGGQLNK